RGEACLALCWEARTPSRHGGRALVITLPSFEEPVPVGDEAGLVPRRRLRHLRLEPANRAFGPVREGVHAPHAAPAVVPRRQAVHLTVQLGLDLALQEEEALLEGVVVPRD